MSTFVCAIALVNIKAILYTSVMSSVRHAKQQRSDSGYCEKTEVGSCTLKFGPISMVVGP